MVGLGHLMLLGSGLQMAFVLSQSTTQHTSSGNHGRGIGLLGGWVGKGALNGRSHMASGTTCPSFRHPGNFRGDRGYFTNLGISQGQEISGDRGSAQLLLPNSGAQA